MKYRILIAVSIAVVLVSALTLAGFLMPETLSYSLSQNQQQNTSTSEKSLGKLDALFPESENKPVVQTVTMLVAGDIMLDRTVYSHALKNNNFYFPFSLIDEYLTKPFDIRIANLEGPVTDFKSVAQTSRFTFTFDKRYLEPIKKYFDFVSLANNHITNFGQKGVKQTKQNLDSVGVGYFGDYDNLVGTVSTSTVVNGVSIAFVGYHELSGKGFENVIAEIKKLNDINDLVIVFPHWGIEYETKKPSLKQQKEAHQMIDAGADIIYGTHPHVIQPIEEYNNKVIFYSLGNFIFDQYFSVETSEGLTIQTLIEKKKIR